MKERRHEMAGYSREPERRRSQLREEESFWDSIGGDILMTKPSKKKQNSTAVMF
jgi:hypothetical protein